ncbi:MAG: hypothetical protein M1605_01510 [Candidatus Thermoplasmatota archaeon]|nr:hypothetical protein [Candidatus Thermoplasmatota archaeon]
MAFVILMEGLLAAVIRPINKRSNAERLNRIFGTMLKLTRVMANIITEAAIANAFRDKALLFFIRIIYPSSILYPRTYMIEKRRSKSARDSEFKGFMCYLLIEEMAKASIDNPTTTFASLFPWELFEIINHIGRRPTIVIRNA